MEKKYFLLIAFLLFWGGVRSQYYRNDDSGLLMGGNVGYTYPTGDFGKMNKNGLGVNFSAKYLINRVLGIGLESGYHSFKSDIAHFSQKYKCSLVPLVAEATFYIPTWDRTLLPYCGLHFGGYMARVEIHQQYSALEPAVSKGLNIFSPGGGPDVGVLLEVSDELKLDLKLKGDYIPKIEDSYRIDEYKQGNIGFKKIMDVGISIGVLYTL